MADKKYFRIRLRENYPSEKKIANGVLLTKRWLVKTGEASIFENIPGVEIQIMAKENGRLAPAGGGEGGTGVLPHDSDAAGEKPPDFNAMLSGQLKSFLLSKGAPQNDFSGVSKQELVKMAKAAHAGE